MRGKIKPRSERGLRFPLSWKLSLALLTVAFLMVVFLFGYFGPHTTKSFLECSNGLIVLSRDALREMVRKSTSESKELLVSLIRHTMDSRRRYMMDLPLSLYGNDIGKIQQVVEQTDARRSSQLEKNVEILAEEMERRFLIEVDRRLESLGEKQASMGAAFAADIRRSNIILVSTVFLLLFLLLGLGLYRTIVHPLIQLRKSTQAVARGELQFDVPVRSRDEVGGLSIDFALMVDQLRDSREKIRNKNLELQELNRNLKTEVARKTHHLEQMLDDLRRTQKQLIHAEKMASIGTLAGGLAHEFNNLIGGIRGCATEALETEKDKNRRESLEVILRTANRANQITDKLLRFSKQRSVKMKFVDVTKILDEALVLIEPDARKRQVSIVRKIGQGIPFWADGDALHQVFLNLYTNALQAMPERGKLTVEAKTTDRELIMRISDTGVGIPANQIDHIFEPFFTTKDQESDPTLRGSGLGLSVSYSIIEAHAGTLEVESEVGRGTVFTIRLPITGEGSQKDYKE